MDNLTLYQRTCASTSRMVTRRYSTSFSRACTLFEPKIRKHIYNIYGFVRLADEIVDTFHAYDKEKLLKNFELEYENTHEIGISTNPIINAFYFTQKENNIPKELVDAFLNSMRMDLGLIHHLDKKEYDQYIFGSAEVVGLMCLKVFVKGDEKQYETLKPFAQSLGAAFQKINFLRDICFDFHDLNRTYFPNIDFSTFSIKDKLEIEKEIEQDFKNALKGIKKLPMSSNIAVFMAYKYYYNLFKKIKKTKPEVLLKKRIRISNARKMALLAEMVFSQNINLIRTNFWS